jgi:GR25 family glycosyltransferase involved in LPS biosynthesis
MIVHLINLDRSADRLARFIAANGGIADFVRFPAVDGGLLDIAAIAAHGVIADDSLADYTAGALGNALSHLCFWEKVIEAGEMMTVCEDDTIFHSGFAAHAAAVIERLPAEWDLVLWGWNFDAGMQMDLLPGVSPALVFGDEEALRANLDAFRAGPSSPQPYRLLQAFGLLCYSLSAKGARALKDFCLPIRPMGVYLPAPNRNLLDDDIFVPNAGIDVMLSALYPQIRAYVSVPPLVVSPNDERNSTVQRQPLLRQPAPVTERSDP